jgi:hypothetical protein
MDKIQDIFTQENLEKLKDNAKEFGEKQIKEWSDPETYTAKGTAAMLVGLYFGYTRVFRPIKDRAYYRRQGIPFDGWEVPFFGDSAFLTSLDKYQESDPLNNHIKDLYPDGKKVPDLVGASIFNHVWLFITDADLYKQIIVDHGKDIDRGDSLDEANN